MGQTPSDTEYSILTAQSMVFRGSIAIPPHPNLSYLVLGRGGFFYSNFGIGYAALFVPQIAFAKGCSRLFKINPDYCEQAVYSFTNTIFAAAIVTVLHLIFMTLGYSRKVSLVSLACIACASILLPYSKILHAETPTVLLLLLFLLSVAQNRKLTAAYGGYCAAIATMLLLVKVGNFLYSCGIALYILWLFFKRERSVKGVAAFFSIVSVTGLSYLIFNYVRFGNLFNSGYGEEQTVFTTPLLSGLFGILFSPSRSVFIFSPLIIVSILAIPWCYKKFKPTTIIVLGFAAANIVLYAKWRDWHGGWCWGPRLIVPVLIMLHIFLPEYLARIRGRKWKLILICPLLLAALYVNAIGSLVWYQQIDHFQKNYWSLRYSDVVTGSKLFYNKIQNKPEVYCAGDFGLTNPPAYYEQVFKVRMRGDSLDFTEFEKFRGLSTMWSGIAKNFHIRFLWIMPVCLFLFSLAGYLLLWKSADSPSSFGSSSSNSISSLNSIGSSSASS